MVTSRVHRLFGSATVPAAMESVWSTKGEVAVREVLGGACRTAVPE